MTHDSNLLANTLNEGVGVTYNALFAMLRLSLLKLLNLVVD